jgi:hypothetical protein
MTCRPKPASCSSSSRYRRRLPARTTSQLRIMSGAGVGSRGR